MRRITALWWGLLAATWGLLRSWPVEHMRGRRWLALARFCALELPTVGVLAGIVALWKGLRARSRIALELGALGIGLGLRPWLRRAEAERVMADAMRDGLGLGWQRAIPPDVHRRFAQAYRTEQLGPLVRLITRHVWETRDVLFAAPGGNPLRLDVVQPAGQRAGHAAIAPRPAIIVVHGDTWFAGDKSAYGWGLQNRWFAAHGYVVFDIQYRQAERWPAPLHDVTCAIRWVKANAERFNIDPERVALLGRSMGSHLALVAAYTAGDPAYQGQCNDGERDDDPAVDTHVCAVVASGAPADLRLWAAEQDSAITRLMGGLPQDVPDAYASAAPVTHIRYGLPPTLIIHGQHDRRVSPTHAELLVNRLRAAGVVSVLLRVPGGEHGIDGLPVGFLGAMIQHDIDRFLAWVFYGQRVAN